MDIKPSNMLITKWQRDPDMCHMTVKLSDFGSAGQAEKDTADTYTPEYALPGLHSGTVMGPEHDFYSWLKSFQDIVSRIQMKDVHVSRTFSEPCIKALPGTWRKWFRDILQKKRGHAMIELRLQLSHFDKLTQELTLTHSQTLKNPLAEPIFFKKDLGCQCSFCTTFPSQSAARRGISWSHPPDPNFPLTLFGELAVSLTTGISISLVSC